MNITGGGITELKSKGAVKSVQRGQANIAVPKNGTATIVLSAIDPDKSVLDYEFSYTQTTYGAKPSVQGLSSDGIVLQNTGTIDTVASGFWQVAEFY